MMSVFYMLSVPVFVLMYGSSEVKSENCTNSVVAAMIVRMSLGWSKFANLKGTSEVVYMYVLGDTDHLQTAD